MRQWSPRVAPSRSTLRESSTEDRKAHRTVSQSPLQWFTAQDWRILTGLSWLTSSDRASSSMRKLDQSINGVPGARAHAAARVQRTPHDRV
jgi:hypothetical protein